MVDASASPMPEYSMNKKKYLQLFNALCRNSKEAEKKAISVFDEKLISKKINQLEENTQTSPKEFDWLHKKVAEKPKASVIQKKVVVVRNKPSKMEEKLKRKEIEELKKHIIEAKQTYSILKRKGVSKEKLDLLKRKIDEMEKHQHLK